jgi:protein-disulfide isomerase
MVYRSEVKAHHGEWPICAARAGHGWELHAALLERPTWRGPRPSEPAFQALADSLGLDGPALSACAQSEEVAGEVARDQALGAADGVAAVPALRLDGRALEPMTPRALLRAVERALR